MIRFFFVLAVCLLTSFFALGQNITPAQNKALLAAKQGAIVRLDSFLSEKIATMPYQKYVLPGPQFIISDDPEYIRANNVKALQEDVQPGSVRFYLYNVNGIKEPVKMPSKITVLIRNKGREKMNLKMQRYSSQKPTANYFKSAKESLKDYFTSSPSKTVVVPPGKAIPLDEKLEKQVVLYDQLVHGIYEFTIDQPAQITVLQTDPSTPGPDAIDRIDSIIPAKGKNAGRGLYGVCNYLVKTDAVYTTSEGSKALVVADGKTDPWIWGVEGVSGKLNQNAGNYGVMYNIELKWKSTDGKGLALVTWNSRNADNKWCGGMANTMVLDKGKFKEGVAVLPSDKLNTKGAPEVILIQVYPPSKNGEEQTIKFTYSPPGASCLPTPLIFIPVDME